MSSHRALKDLYKAYVTIGPGILDDPGDAGTITVEHYGQICEMTSAGAETRTLARPDRSGIPFHLRLYSDGGNVTVTVTGGVNSVGDTELTFADAGDAINLISVRASATTFRWDVQTGNVGVVVSSSSPSSSPSSSVSNTPSSSPSASVSNTPSSSPSSSVSNTPSSSPSTSPSSSPSAT